MKISPYLCIVNGKEENMKLRIVKVTEEGSGVKRNTRYYVQKRARIFFIPYWDSIRNNLGDAEYFWNIEDAIKYLDTYEGYESEVVYTKTVK